ncbi:MAG: hypothetical protein ACOX6U_06055 [Oscillospiraceae bacterium]|jgi:hypothetical protein
MKKGIFFTLFLVTGFFLLLVSLVITVIEMVFHKRQTSPMI